MMSGNVKPKVRECGQHYNKPIIGLCLEEILIGFSFAGTPTSQRVYRLILREEFRITSGLGDCLIVIHSFLQVTTNPFFALKYRLQCTVSKSGSIMARIPNALTTNNNILRLKIQTRILSFLPSRNLASTHSSSKTWR